MTWATPRVDLRLAVVAWACWVDSLISTMAGSVATASTARDRPLPLRRGRRPPPRPPSRHHPRPRRWPPPLRRDRVDAPAAHAI